MMEFDWVFTENNASTILFGIRLPLQTAANNEKFYQIPNEKAYYSLPCQGAHYDEYANFAMQT
jgi:hypothetical protein